MRIADIAVADLLFAIVAYCHERTACLHLPVRHTVLLVCMEFANVETRDTVVVRTGMDLHASRVVDLALTHFAMVGLR